MSLIRNQCGFLHLRVFFFVLAKMDYSSNDHNSTASLVNVTVIERLVSDKSTDIHNNLSSQDDITSMKARLLDFDTTNNYGLYIRLGYGDCKCFDLNTAAFNGKFQNLFYFCVFSSG